MTNRYTYEVIKCNGNPLHFVYIVTECYTAVKVFSTKKDADKYIRSAKWFFRCEYDYNLSIPTGIVREYKNNEHMFSKIVNREVCCGYR